MESCFQTCPYATSQLSLSPVAAPRGQLWRFALSVPTTTSVNQNTAEASRAPNAAKTPAKLGVENRGRQTPGAETHRICSSCHILFWQTLHGNITAPHHLDLNEHGKLFRSRACSILRQACASRFCRIRYRFSILIHPETKSPPHVPLPKSTPISCNWLDLFVERSMLCT